MAQMLTNPPKGDQFFPNTLEKAEYGPRLVFRPMANSVINSGMDHKNRKINHGMRNEPPPFRATSLGNRQILPVPTAMPIQVRIMAQRELNLGGPTRFSFMSFQHSPLKSTKKDSCSAPATFILDHQKKHRDPPETPTWTLLRSVAPSSPCISQGMNK